MKPYYSDMVTHCLKFYVRHRDPKFRSSVDKKNWYACDNAFKGFSDLDREMLKDVYIEGDVLHVNVRRVAERYKVNPDDLWKKVHDLEHKVAKRRGLI